MTINTYLTFSGNCREAMVFYQECLGGELVLQTIGDSPMAEKMPARMKASILHATLKKGKLVIFATDMVHDDGLVRGNNVSLMLDCGNEKEIRRCYEKLSAGGKQDHPLEPSFWGTLCGDLTDKFGNRWMLQYAVDSLQ